MRLKRHDHQEPSTKLFFHLIILYGRRVNLYSSMLSSDSSSDSECQMTAISITMLLSIDGHQVKTAPVIRLLTSCRCLLPRLTPKELVVVTEIDEPRFHLKNTRIQNILMPPLPIPSRGESQSQQSQQDLTPYIHAYSDH